MEMIKKLLNVDIKEIGERSLQFVGSTETADRDGEVILASGWDLKNYRKNPVFMWAHKYDQPPVGRTTKVRVKDGQLLFDVEFAPRETYEFADTIYKLYKGGFLHATSVGFVPIDFVDGDGEKTARRTYKKQELLELSGCPIPSNPDALRLACDSGVVTIKQLKDIGMEVPKPEVVEELPPEIKIEPKGISQNAIRDEIDYLNELVESEVDEKTKTMLLELAHKINILCKVPTETIPQPVVVKIESAPQQTEIVDYGTLVDLARKVGEDVASKFKG
jgi:HK97 family phage prohead protease